jgi:cell division protein FtsW
MNASVLAPSTGPRTRIRFARYDEILVWVCLFLLGFGLVMVYSATVAVAEASTQTGRNAGYYLLRQGMFLVLGLSTAWMAFSVPMRAWQKAAPWLFLLCLVALAVVLIPGLGREVNGSRRWISLLVVNLQPSEFMKLAAVLYAADYTQRKAGWMDSVTKGFAPLALAMVLVGGLLLLEPDFGAFVVVMAIAVSILFLGGFNWRLFAGLLVVLGVSFAALIVSSPYRMQRILGFLDPWADPFGKGYQLSHALMAFGRGEFTGVGLGASVEKLFYLPEAHTDFLLAVIAEELGFLGVMVVLAGFVFITLRAFAIAKTATKFERPFSALTAQGIAVWLAVQAGVNMGVNMGMLPTKGLTLPLMSFGGSGLIANCIALAILLRIDFENRLLMRGKSP